MQRTNTLANKPTHALHNCLIWWFVVGAL